MIRPESLRMPGVPEMTHRRVAA
jgi:hypothetical protein